MLSALPLRANQLTALHVLCWAPHIPSDLVVD
jgi:hypothetical protein